MFSSPFEILVISSQILANDLPKIPALSKADTATQVCFVLDLIIFGKAIVEPKTSYPNDKIIPTSVCSNDLNKKAKTLSIFSACDDRC